MDASTNVLCLSSVCQLKVVVQHQSTGHNHVPVVGAALVAHPVWDVAGKQAPASLCIYTRTAQSLAPLIADAVLAHGGHKQRVLLVAPVTLCLRDTGRCVPVKVLVGVLEQLHGSHGLGVAPALGFEVCWDGCATVVRLM